MMATLTAGHDRTLSDSVLEFMRMQIAYLDGDPGTGDRLYRHLHHGAPDNGTRVRDELCGWLAKHNGPACAVIRDEQPQPGESRPAADGVRHGTVPATQ
jgi:hypothetical protein